MRTGGAATLSLAIALSSSLALAQTPASKPNVIFIMSDDHPWSVYGFMKTIEDSGTFPVPTQHPDFPPIHTPNLDRLAARGAVFPIGASGQSRCIPSYHSALTGFYPQPDHSIAGDPGVQIPTYLAGAGYISYGYGKLWNTYEAAGFTHGGVRDWDAPRITIDPVWQFVDARRSDGPPWFLWYGPRLPHQGYDESVHFRHLFPVDIFKSRSVVAQRHYANVMLLDFWIGKLLDGLEARGLDDETFIVFMSDNGFLMPNSKDRPGENGVRTRMLVSWPGVIPPNLVLPQMAHAVDILPTLLDYAGENTTLPVDGQSLRPYIEDPSLPGREFLFTSQPPAGRFLRTRDGIRFGVLSGRQVVHDLKVDPDEKTNLIEDPQFNDMIPVWQRALDEFADSVGARSAAPHVTPAPALAIGDFVEVSGVGSAGLPSSDETCGAPFGHRAEDDIGEVIGGPGSCSGLPQWRVHWSGDDRIGWSAATGLTKVLCSDRDRDSCLPPPCGPDCNDTVAVVGCRDEACKDGRDNDCDGDADCRDADCSRDDDLDGCMALPCGEDCGDGEAAVGCRNEVCGDGVDNDCNGAADCEDDTCTRDADRDGCLPPPCGNDCNDTVGAVGCRAEVCMDGRDNDCDGDTDCRDTDCGRDEDLDNCVVVPCGKDCDDQDPLVGCASELCDDSRDNDCNGAADCVDGACDGAPCDDGVFCDGPDSCIGGGCRPVAGDPCPGPDGDANCAESCNELAANCAAPDPDGSPCELGLAGSVMDACEGGMCMPGATTTLTTTTTLQTSTTEVPVATTSTTNVSVPATSTTNVSLPTTSTTNVSVPATSTTNVSLPTTSTTNVSVPTTSTTNVSVPTTSTTNVSLPATSTTNVSLPTTSTTNVSVPTTSTTLVPAGASHQPCSPGPCYAHPIAARKLTIRSLATRPGKTALIFVSRARYALPAGAHVPTEEGATLTIQDSGGQRAQLFLPATSWRSLGRAGGRGFIYSDKRRRHGPCTKVLLKAGRTIKATCVGPSIALAPPLIEPVDVVLQAGAASSWTSYCARFGGAVTRNGGGSYVVTNAPAPTGCPLGVP